MKQRRLNYSKMPKNDGRVKARPFGVLNILFFGGLSLLSFLFAVFVSISLVGSLLAQELVVEEEPPAEELEMISVTKDPRAEILEDLQIWVELAENVLYEPEFDYRKELSSNRSYALIDLRKRFLLAIHRLAIIELIDTRPPGLRTPSRSARYEQASKNAFYLAVLQGVEALECFVLTDFRDYKRDSYIRSYTKIRNCFRLKVESMRSHFQSAARNLRQAVSLDRTSYSTYYEGISESTDEYFERIRDTNFLYPESGSGDFDREEKIHILEHHMIDNLVALLKELCDSSNRARSWNIYQDQNDYLARLEDLRVFLVDFAQAGGPPYQAHSKPVSPENMKDLELDVAELVEIVKSIIAAG